MESNTNNTQNNSANPHYENIYESIDQYAAAVAPAVTADNIPQLPLNVNGLSPNIPNPVVPVTVSANIATQQSATSSNGNTLNRSQNQNVPNTSLRPNQAYRNELYDRTAGYDVPRQMFRSMYAGGASINSSTTGSKRRANLHLDLNPNRPRYTTASRPHRQRSFDDTESNHYNNFRYENIYEQIHEEPIYRNFSSAGVGPSGRVCSRLGVIGHGIGRIERHLSSSCGNIDHYNLGGHYAVLGHSHLGTVGHIRLNAGPSPAGTSSKDTNGIKSLNFFSCLGRENSQSMNNIHRAAAGSVPPQAAVPTSAASTILRQATGAIPKTPKQKANTKSTDEIASGETTQTSHDSSLNRISKSSLQWLLVNKWLPMWIGQEPDYNILDFNFMFSRNCGGCGDTFNRQQSVVRFNGHAEMRPRNDHGIARRAFGATNNAPTTTGGSLRPMRLNHSLTRLREREYGPLMRRDGSLDERNRIRENNLYERERYREEYYERLARSRVEPARETDPFRNWELNTENNSFRPAGGVTRSDIRRITDGTYPSSNGQSSNMTRQLSKDSTPKSNRSVSGATTPKLPKAMERLPKPRVTMDSRTESGNESPSPDLGGRRYSDNTEDDQHNDDDDNDTDND